MNPIDISPPDHTVWPRRSTQRGHVVTGGHAVTTQSLIMTRLVTCPE